MEYFEVISNTEGESLGLLVNDSEAARPLTSRAVGVCCSMWGLQSKLHLKRNKHSIVVIAPSKVLCLILHRQHEILLFK